MIMSTTTRTAISQVLVIPLLLSLLVASTETHAFTPNSFTSKVLKANPGRSSFHFLQGASTSTSSSSTSSSTPSKEVTSSIKSEESEESSDFDNILQTRRTINDFQPNLPEKWELTLQQAVESAMYAPNHKRTEPWRFHLLGQDTIRQVCELNASIVTDKKGEKAGEKKLNRWLQMPGWLVVTCRNHDEATSDSGTSSGSSSGSMEDPSGIEREDYAACCCAVQNLCLSLHNAGMGTKWTTGPVNFDPRFNEIVGLDNGEYVVGTIWFGIPEKVPDAPKKRKSLDDVFIKHE